MKKKKLNLLIFCLALLGFINQTSFGQVEFLLTPEVISPMGDMVSTDAFDVSWTLGEPIISTVTNKALYLTQGFHQSDDIYLDVEAAPQLQLVITPNDDGLNDQFVLESILNYPENEIKIFNRWGSTIWQAAPYQNDWRGENANGKPMPEGTYYYMVRLKKTGEYLYGSITIKR